uniref:Sjogren syndrome nuclear autoantigen 1 n=1 Tax=Meleagris gallopavo TaxID=9103 RepID=G1N493_MELGA
MTQQGAVLQGYNNELVKCIEDLCMQKEELNKQIQQAEEEKSKLQHEIQVLNEQLECVCENLAQKVASRNELDKILAETEAAYMKILDSSRTLLNVLKKEVGSLKHAPELKTVSVLVVSHTLQFLLPNKSSFGYQLRLTVSQDNLAHISSFWTFILLAE